MPFYFLDDFIDDREKLIGGGYMDIEEQKEFLLCQSTEEASEPEPLTTAH